MELGCRCAASQMTTDRLTERLVNTTMRKFISIIETALKESDLYRSERLMSAYGGKVFTYADLPQEGKNAVKAYYVDDLGFNVPPTSPWGYVELPVDVLKNEIGGNGEYDSFDEYHKWYIDGGDIPNYIGTQFAVILGDDEDEVLLDGWHRFHDYVRKGEKVIPAIVALDKEEWSHLEDEE